METLFWLSLLGALYSYFVYPLILLALPRRASRPIAQINLPSVSVIIAARNEASRLREKLENTLSVDYPRERMEVIVASDASDDDTDAIAASYAMRNVRLARTGERGGKEHAQRLGIEAARGDILVFTDVATRLDSQGIRAIVRPFADARVGAVSSEDRFLDDHGRRVGEGAYVRYEMWLRRLEASGAGLVGLSGSFFAVRRELCSDFDTRTPSDFNTALTCARRGYCSVVAPEARGYYRDLVDDNREYVRKYRTALRGMASLWLHREVLDPWTYGVFAFQVWSHKPLRWLVPWFLVLLALTTPFLNGFAFIAAFLAQCVFYSLVLAGALWRPLRRFHAVRLPFFFAQVNAALAHAALHFILGRRVSAWEPSRR